MLRRIINAWNGVEDTALDADVPDRAPVKTTDFKDMVHTVRNPDPNTVIVDVREPGEFEVVQIPHSINVPYKSHPNAFAMPELEFRQTFGVDKPIKNKKLIFLCASGMRAGKAEQVAYNNGYHNTVVYTGSMNDWVDKGGSEMSL